MISYNYDFSKFIDYIKDIDDYNEILRISHLEVDEADRRIAPGRRGTPKEREKGCFEYAREVRSFIYFMNHFTKPSDSYCFSSYYVVCKNLVDKNVLKPEVLSLFNIERK